MLQTHAVLSSSSPVENYNPRNLPGSHPTGHDVMAVTDTSILALIWTRCIGLLRSWLMGECDSSERAWSFFCLTRNVIILSSCSPGPQISCLPPHLLYEKMCHCTTANLGCHDEAPRISSASFRPGCDCLPAIFFHQQGLPPPSLAPPIFVVKCKSYERKWGASKGGVSTISARLFLPSLSFSSFYSSFSFAQPLSRYGICDQILTFRQHEQGCQTGGGGTEGAPPTTNHVCCSYP